MKPPTVKSPLRYAGGKSRAIERILAQSPDTFTEYREPFLGGGSVFLAFKQKYPDAKYWINDLNPELYCFWVQARDDVRSLMERVEGVWAGGKDDGRALFEQYRDMDTSMLSTLARAVRFFVLNRITFSGTVEAGGYSQQAFEGRFTLSSIERLEPLQALLYGVRITNIDYANVIAARGDDVFIFLDPPYTNATRLYGKKGVLQNLDHDLLAFRLRDTHHRWLMTYDDTPYVREMYDWATLKEWELQYGMNNYKQARAAMGKELFISPPPRTQP